ncbi:MAG: hypothetical protein ABJB74_23300 [Gemmatimonas sp.]
MSAHKQAKRRDGRRGDAGDAVVTDNQDAGHRRDFSRPIIAVSVAALTLFFGYGDLWRGGDSVSALLLTVAYVVMVPIAIMAGPRRGRG